MTIRAHALLLALLLAACSGGGGGSSPTPAPPVASGFSDNTVYSSASGASLTAANEFVSVTRHQLAIGGQTLDYTATAGHMTALSLGTGAARASFFYVAYTLDGAAPSTRPVTFFYNGGPGSATVWLHLGSFGPQRLATGVPSSDLARPFALVPNTESLIDLSDLVFVDAVGSGFSQAIAPNTNRTFWGVDDDAEAFRDFVMRYAIVNGRAASPKFLYGESYGGPRSGVLADMLEAAGVHLTGVVLQSPAMNYNANCGISTGVSSCGGYLPSFGTTGAWFHRSTPSPAAPEIPAFVAQLRTLTATRYAPALSAYLANIVQPDPALLTDLSLATGLSVPQWQSHFNMGPDYVRANLVANTLLGRYDSRITLPTQAPNSNIDPSDELIGSSFAYRITEYLAALGYTNPSSYTLLSQAIQTWRFSHDGNSLPDTIPDLASAMTQNPRLKVLAVNGYHDLATPFFTTENDLARLGSNPNVTVRNYMGGHMTYLDDASRPQMKADLAAFYRSALGN
jgi:carboxypeptidase C (cathepsin A)